VTRLPPFPPLLLRISTMRLSHALRLLSAALLCVGALAAPLRAEEALTPEQKESFERVIREYLLNHPEVLIEALQAAEEKANKAAEDRAQQAIAARQRDLLGDPEAPVIGNPKGDVTLVEFFDYRCPYCKQVHADVRALVGEDKQLRVVYKEFPVLGKESVYAAHAALAAHKQGKYDAFHNALMGLKGQMGEEVVLKTAGSVGLDVERLKKDMAAPDIEAQLKRNYDLARALEIRGTPAFVIGGALIPGAVDAAALRQKIAEARKAG
jgi:protein-disulfide isomerase